MTPAILPRIRDRARLLWHWLLSAPGWVRSLGYMGLPARAALRTWWEHRPWPWPE